MEIQRVAKDLHFAEGPVWSYEGYLLSSDTVIDKLRKLTPGAGDVVFAEHAGGVIGNAYDTEGRLYTCGFRERRVTRTLKNGKIEVLASRFEGKRSTHPTTSSYAATVTSFSQTPPSVLNKIPAN